MSLKPRTIRTKDGIVISTAVTVAGGAGTPPIYGNETYFEETGSDYFNELEVSVSVPVAEDEACTLFCRAQAEFATPFSGQAAQMFFKPFSEYSPPGSAYPIVKQPIDVFGAKYVPLMGIISLAAGDVTAGTYTVTAVGQGFSLTSSDSGFSYVAIKLAVIKGDYTGDSTVNF